MDFKSRSNTIKLFFFTLIVINVNSVMSQNKYPVLFFEGYNSQLNSNIDFLIIEATFETSVGSFALSKMGDVNSVRLDEKEMELIERWVYGFYETIHDEDIKILDSTYKLTFSEYDKNSLLKQIEFLNKDSIEGLINFIYMNRNDDLVLSKIVIDYLNQIIMDSAKDVLNFE